MNETTIANIVTLIAIVMALAAGHYIPWHAWSRLVDENKQLKVELRYVYGVGWIFVGYIFLVIFNRYDWMTIIALAAVIIAAAVGTLGPRVIWKHVEHAADHEARIDGTQEPRR